MFIHEFDFKKSLIFMRYKYLRICRIIFDVLYIESKPKYSRTRK